MDDRDRVLGEEAVRLLREKRLEIFPVQRILPSQAQRVKPLIAETRAVKWFHIGTFAFWGCVALAVWIFISAPGVLTAAIAFAVGWAGWKLSFWTARVGVVNAAISSPDLFAALWNLRAYALGWNGELYDASSGARWQDLVHLAAGRENQVQSKPISRQEHLDAVFEQIRRR